VALRQGSKDFYAVGIDAMVKRWDKCINVGGGCVEICMFFFPCSNITKDEMGGSCSTNGGEEEYI
jgi:hypothetical protein